MRTVIIAIFTLISFSSFGQEKTVDNEKCRSLYNQEKFTEAYSCYAADEDSFFSVYMAAYLAKFLDEKKNFKRHYKALLSDKFKSAEAYYLAATLHPKNSKKYLKVIKKGLKNFAKDTTLLQGKVDYYVTLKSYDLAFPILEELQGLVKDKKSLNIKTADIYVAAEMDQKAISYFEKVLEVDAENYHANLGLGNIYFNMASDLILSANKSENGDDRDLKEKEMKSLLRRALPYLEVAYSSNNENKDLKSNLLTCYSKLDMVQEYNALMQS